ncbi:MAG TPA: hypothetical protein VGS62_04925, partial [Streptosporangiaceae bacterium]|nr:hypothetical protein [Streptosporangiaceae bacterium]
MTPRPAAAPSEMELTHASRDYPHPGRQARVLRQSPARQFTARQFPASRGQQLAAPEAGLALPPHPGSVRTARDFTASMLRRWGMPVLSGEAGLVVSELVTNALRHGLRGAAAPARPGNAGPGSRSD